jgi:hypothetical protein
MRRFESFKITSRGPSAAKAPQKPNGNHESAKVTM